MRYRIFGVMLSFALVACGSDEDEGGGKGGTSGTGASGGAGGSGGTGGSSFGGSGGFPQEGGVAGSSTGGSAGAAGAGGAVSSTGTLVPLYTYPSDTSWAAIIAAKQAHPTVPVIAVFNPSSGPGTSVDPTYVTATNQLKTAGIVVLAYVATGYTARDPDTEVKPEIDDYVAWYPATMGIFFDEQSNNAGDEGYYSSLNAYAKSKALTFTVGNPGADTSESFVGALDMMLIYETSGLPELTALGGWHDNHDKKNFGIIPYAVPSLDTSFVAQAKTHVGYIYLTDDNLPNPWDSLTPYFNELLSALED